MVRATTARVLIRLGGTYPVNHDATSVGNMCTDADYLLDGETHPDTLSTTGNNEIELACSIVLNMIAEADWVASGGYATGQPKPVVITRAIKATIDRLSSTSTFKGFTTGTQQAADT